MVIMRTMDKRKFTGIILVLGAVFIIGFVLVRALYGTPDAGDPGLEGEMIQGSTLTAGAITSTTPSEQPSRLLVPKVGIDSHVQHIGINSKGLMAVPSNYTDTGWYKLGTAPGEQGSAVIAGHQDNGLGTPAVFYELEKLEIGDDVYVVDKNGDRLHFKVRKMETVPYNLQGEKLETIFTDSSGKYLNLITCAGTWIPEAKTNDLRLIVYTELVE